MCLEAMINLTLTVLQLLKIKYFQNISKSEEIHYSTEWTKKEIEIRCNKSNSERPKV